jgi:hypothetical protein
MTSQTLRPQSLARIARALHAGYRNAPIRPSQEYASGAWSAGGRFALSSHLTQGEARAVTETVEPGKWYLAINCVYCGEAIPFAPAPEPGLNLYPRHQAVADLKCPLCTHVGTYQPSLIYRYQAPQPRRR